MDRLTGCLIDGWRELDNRGSGLASGFSCGLEVLRDSADYANGIMAVDHPGPPSLRARPTHFFLACSAP